MEGNKVYVLLYLYLTTWCWYNHKESATWTTLVWKYIYLQMLWKNLFKVGIFAPDVALFRVWHLSGILTVLEVNIWTVLLYIFCTTHCWWNQSKEQRQKQVYVDKIPWNVPLLKSIQSDLIVLLWAKVSYLAGLKILLEVVTSHVLLYLYSTTWC